MGAGWGISAQRLLPDALLVWCFGDAGLGSGFFFFFKCIGVTSVNKIT